MQPFSSYPQYVCRDCASKAADEDGRKLVFYNIDISGGYISKYEDTKDIYDSHTCNINGIKCYADKAIFSGILIQKE